MVQPPASVLTLCTPTVPVPGGKGSGGGLRVGEGGSGTLTSCHFLFSLPFVRAEGPLVATSWRGGP